MVGERPQRRVLRHRQPRRPQCGVAVAPQRLLHPLDQIAHRALRFPNAAMTGTLHWRYGRVCKEPDKEETMTTIERHGPYATLINVFTVEPEHAAELADLLDRRDRAGHAAPAGLPCRPTSTSAPTAPAWSTTRSGMSAEAFAAMQADPAAQEHMRAAAETRRRLRPAPLHGRVGTSAPDGASPWIWRCLIATCSAAHWSRCGTDPVTGFYRDGCCSDGDPRGSRHVTRFAPS